MNEEKPQLDPHPLSPYVAWAGKRNRDAILAVLEEQLPKSDGHVLEIASGSGMHVSYFAPHFKHLCFHPSDFDENVFDNIKQLKQEKGIENMRDPVKLDLLSQETWSNPSEQFFDVIISINILQVAPFEVGEGIMQCSGKLLKPGGFLYMYGPFKVNGEFSSPSNEEFDRQLRSAGVPFWGLKDVADLTAAAKDNGLVLKDKLDTPTNNFSLLFSKPLT
ncbi:MAG: DUF938 domain-containing protein [Mastigocoleus sp. MO_167.B18]|uniref:DUF938 domain-containing protein n=1 Tax=Mastigocoleus sp. MO_188.B34 TaxID=3036635 RepID=UPI002603475C|nr:DUF938 domain-containing protein [Mastigocoleus sp. MO_188.B34]MDJ0694837.1 DUF938 domain-containing protein [Mastigocoleus sp. MO_188.B34]MDJ0775538.1 DUF938 domain-containing protein [Mastigocoleus sp. MO_167.B18]